MPKTKKTAKAVEVAKSVKFGKENRKGAAWIHESNGRHLISGKIKIQGVEKKFVMMTNSFKRVGIKDPAYMLYLAE